MSALTPLKSSLGQPAEGERKYFHRPAVVKKIQRQLNNNEHLLISAPRRIGKSSILKYLKNNPASGAINLYIAVQSVDSSDEFFKKLFNELIKNAAVFKSVEQYLQGIKQNLKNYITRITDVEFSITKLSAKVTVGDSEPIDYYQECLAIFTALERHQRISIFFDEFPDVLTNIRDKNLAIKFLQQHRDLREALSDKALNFVYTGSTGLKNAVKRLDRLDLINDFYEIKIPPLTTIEAFELLSRLALGYAEYNAYFTLTEKTKCYITEKISWKLPYYMQIICSELFEQYEDDGIELTETSVDAVLTAIVRSNSTHADYFENWKRRLRSSFLEREYPFAIEVLNYIAIHERITAAVFHDLSVKHQVDDHHYVLDVLIHDGYISEDRQQYGFNSVLLKEWWYINVAT